MVEALTTFDSTKEFLLDLLKDVARGEVQLPDFQRGWVWDDDHLKSLLASVSLSFPIGAVMMLETGNPNVRFQPRVVEGVRLAESQPPDRLILDGQQRLTSLFQSLMMDEPVRTRDTKGTEILRWYYIDLHAALDPFKDREEAVVSVPADKVVYDHIRRETLLDVSSLEKECAASHLPAGLLLDNNRLMNWQMTYLQLDPEAMGERLEWWKRVQEQVLQPFMQYQVPVITLHKQTTKEAVCKVFEKVNTGGVSLSVFELLTATFAADNYSLREDWAHRKERLSQIPVLTKVEPTDFLATVTLLATLSRRGERADAPVSAKRKDMLQLSLSEYEKWAEPATVGYERCAKLLFAQKVLARKYLPYPSQLIPLAAILAALDDRAETDGAKKKLHQWFWCGILGELYGSATETRFSKDVPQVIDWIEGGATPDTVSDAVFTPDRLRTLRTRNSAAYKGLHALVMRQGAIDFRTGATIDEQTYFDENIEIHHVFPQSWCRKNSIEAGLMDSIVNKTPLSSATNRAIGGAAPSTYLPKIANQAGVDANRMDAILETHLIDPGSIRRDDFSSFFAQREREMLSLIEVAMGKAVARPSALQGAGEGSIDVDIELQQGATAFLVPPDARGVLVVEGDTDLEYLLIAVEKSGRPELLEGIHVHPAGGVNAAVLAAVLLREQSDLPVFVLLDKDQPGRAARDTLTSRFGFQNKIEVMTYGDFLQNTQDDIEAEDMIPAALWERFIETFGESNVLTEKVRLKSGSWHFGFNATGKEQVGGFLRETASATDMERWIGLLELVRVRLGI